VQELALAAGKPRRRVERHEAAEEDEARVVAVAVDDVLPRLPRLVGLEVVVVALVHLAVALSTGDMSEFPEDARANPDLLVQFPREAVLERLAGVEPPGRHLRSRLGVAPLVEDEQLPPTRDVRDDAEAGQLVCLVRDTDASGYGLYCTFSRRR
jgi:hypothetical protein